MDEFNCRYFVKCSLEFSRLPIFVRLLVLASLTSNVSLLYITLFCSSITLIRMKLELSFQILPGRQIHLSMKENKKTSFVVACLV